MRYQQLYVVDAISGQLRKALDTDLGGAGGFQAYLTAAGFVDDTTTDNRAALQAAIDAGTAAGLHCLEIPPLKNRIRIDGTITFDRNKVEINLGGNEFNWRFATSGPAFDPFCGSHTATDFVRPSRIIYNGAILRRDASNVSMRDDSNARGMDALQFDDMDADGTGRGECQDLVVDGFRHAANIGPNCYLLRFVNCWMLRNVTSYFSNNVTAGNFSNEGEAIEIYGGLIWGYRGIDVQGIFVHLFGPSIDYVSPGAPTADIDGLYQYLFKVTHGGQLYGVAKHVEFRDFQRSSDEAICYVGADSVLDWQGGPLYLADAAYDGSALSNSARGYHQYANLRYLVKLIGNAQAVRINRLARQRTALLKSNGLIGMADGITVPPSVVDSSGSDQPMGSGTLAGKSIAPILGDAAQLNAAGSAVLGSAARFGLLRDPNFAAGSIIDGWHFAGAGFGLAPGQTNRYTATNWLMTIGGNKLICTKAAGGASAMRLVLPVMIQRGRVVGVKFTIDKTGGAAGNVVQAKIHKVVAAPAGVLYQEVWTDLEQIGATKTLITFAGTGAEGPLTFDTNDFAGTLDTGGRVFQNDRGVIFLLYIDLGAIDASTTPCVFNVSRVTVSEQ